LTAQADGPLAFVAANKFAEARVFEEDSEREEVEFCVVRDTGRAVGMLQEVGRKRQEAGERRLDVLLFWYKGDEDVTEELVGMSEIVGRK
jgi:hypothetical protein